MCGAYLFSFCYWFLMWVHCSRRTPLSVWFMAQNVLSWTRLGVKLPSVLATLPWPHRLLSTSVGWMEDWRWEHLERLYSFPLNGGGNPDCLPGFLLTTPVVVVMGVKRDAHYCQEKVQASTWPLQGDPTGMKYWIPALLAFSISRGGERSTPRSLVQVEV